MPTQSATVKAKLSILLLLPLNNITIKRTVTHTTDILGHWNKLGGIIQPLRFILSLSSGGRRTERRRKDGQGQEKKEDYSNVQDGACGCGKPFCGHSYNYKIMLEQERVGG